MAIGLKVLLICQTFKSRKLYANTLPPLGILGLASYLQNYNISVDILDYNIERRPKVDFKEYDIIGLSVNMSNINVSLEFIKYIKIQNPKAKVIIGGPSCISNPQYFTQYENVDAICMGEGEGALLDYIMQESFIDGKEIRGLYTKTRKGHFAYGGSREYINNLDKLPFPALNKVRLHKYNVPISKTFPISSIITSRGCPFHCIFCFHSMGHQWRARSPINVVDEIEWQVKELGAREICIQDDNFSLDFNRAEQIFDLILNRNIKVKLQFQNGLRADLLNLGLLNKMYQAGVWLMGIAPETGSPKIMEQIKKNIDLEKVRQVVLWCKEIGISTFAYFMIGFPFETAQDLKKTASFIQELNTDFMQLARVVLIPTTPLFEEVINEGREDAFGQERGLFFGIPEHKTPEIDRRKVTQLIKQVHKNFYLSPIKMLRLLRILPLHQLIRLFIYSIRTGNI